MDLCHLKNLELEPRYPKYKGRSYSEVTLWRMILVRTQYSLNEGHQHHKWQRQKSWISFPDCRGAQDKQQMQYPLKLRSKWKMHQRYWELQSQNAQILRYFYNLQIKRVSNFSKSQHHAWMIINLKSRNLVSRKIVYSLLTHCSQMSVSGSYWETWHSMVCQ